MGRPRLRRSQLAPANPSPMNSVQTSTAPIFIICTSTPTIMESHTRRPSVRRTYPAGVGGATRLSGGCCGFSLGGSVMSLSRCVRAYGRPPQEKLPTSGPTREVRSLVYLAYHPLAAHSQTGRTKTSASEWRKSAQCDRVHAEFLALRKLAAFLDQR